MTHLKRSRRKSPSPRSPPEENGVMQLKVWLLGISPMIWRRLLVPGTPWIFMLPRRHYGRDDHAG
jgi:hypothetical protein